MLRDRLALALERLDATRWKDFEDLCAAYAAAQYDNLITLAATSGDRGRDAVLWQPEAQPSVVLQYSVAADWKGKVRATIRRLGAEFDGVQVLIFFSSQVIGPAADDLVAEVLRDHGVYVQVRDRNWFLDRVNLDPATDAAAERIVTAIVEPLLSSEGVVAPHSEALTDHEAAAGVIYLAMQLEDDKLEKGLTKVCFDGLVRAALRDTGPDRRVGRQEVHRRVRDMVPSGSEADVGTYVDAALARLDRLFVRHYRAADEFCLANDERRRLADHLVTFENQRSRLRGAIGDQLRVTAEAEGVPLPDDIAPLADRAEELIGRVLLERGEAFVASLQSGTVNVYTFDELLERVVDDLARHAGSLDGTRVPLLAAAIHAVLLRPVPELLAHLQSLARSYTLFSLLKETPNVQRALVKMFTGGEVWLDTTAALPLFAETLAEPEERFFTTLVEAAQGAGVRIYVTPGVVEEVERHMNRSLAYGRARHWEGHVPFLAAAFELAGGEAAHIGGWLEEFRGEARPEDDIVAYLREEAAVEVRGLADEVASAPGDLREAVYAEWRQVQESRRRRSATQLDVATSVRLADHDAENYLGVMQRRRRTTDSQFGYTAWWLTLDRSAYKIHARLARHLAAPPPPPILSPDFLTQYLSIGPIRQYLKEGTETRLPLMLEVGALDFVSPELLATAQQVRRQFAGRPRRIVNRKIRDILDAERRREGPIARAGLGVVEDALHGA